MFPVSIDRTLLNSKRNSTHFTLCCTMLLLLLLLCPHTTLSLTHAKFTEDFAQNPAVKIPTRVSRSGRVQSFLATLLLLLLLHNQHTTKRWTTVTTTRGLADTTTTERKQPCLHSARRRFFSIWWTTLRSNYGLFFIFTVSFSTRFRGCFSLMVCWVFFSHLRGGFSSVKF